MNNKKDNVENLNAYNYFNVKIRDIKTGGIAHADCIKITNHEVTAICQFLERDGGFITKILTCRKDNSSYDEFEVVLVD